MAFYTENFIIDLAKQLNLNNMDDATRARLKDLKKKGVATKKQNGWEPGANPPKIDANDGTDYIYTDDSVATGPAPSHTDLKDLYKKLVVIMRDLAADKELSSENPVKDFLAEFYGTGMAVEPFKIGAVGSGLPISPATPSTPDKDIAKYINSNLGRLTSFFSKTEGIKRKDLEYLADKLDKGTYYDDAKAVKKLNSFLEHFKYYAIYEDREKLPAKDFPACFGTVDPINGVVDDFYSDNVDKIMQNINDPKVDPGDLIPLKDNVNKLFGKLVSNDKLREKFTSKDTDGDITKWINKGLEETNYKSGDHALTPLYTDRRTFWNEAKKKVNDFYVDTLGKLNQKHTRHLYSTNARFIVAELIKKGIKPTDGTAKMVEAFGAINGNLPNPVQKELKWFKEVMEKLSGQDFFKDALRDGDQMRQLVQEIIKAAVHDNKVEEAKVALETLAVMRYTMTTSSVRDKLKATDFTLFSDGGLSWNNNEFVKRVTTAFDKTLKVGLQAAFEVGNLAKNAIKENGVKFKDGTARLDKRTTESVEYANATKKDKMEELFAFWDFVNSSANTKDYNLFMSHKKRQEQVDAPSTTPGSTIMQKRFNDYLTSNSIGK